MVSSRKIKWIPLGDFFLVGVLALLIFMNLGKLQSAGMIISDALDVFKIETQRNIKTVVDQADGLSQDYEATSEFMEQWQSGEIVDSFKYSAPE